MQVDNTRFIQNQWKRTPVRICKNQEKSRGDAELFQDVMRDYSSVMTSLNELKEEQKNILIEELNEIVDGFGDALFINKEMAQVSAADFKDDDVNRIIEKL